MNVRYLAAIPLFALMGTPAAAQDVYENAIADHARVHTDTVILRRNLDQARNRQNARRGAGASYARKAAICADRPRFRRQHGADHPKVLQLDALCARDGF